MNPSFPPFDYESARTNFSFAV
ncbi:MAG: hypothetical protein RL585_1452, partial [Pseudomonadota bacterium]